MLSACFTLISCAPNRPARQTEYFDLKTVFTAMKESKTLYEVKYDPGVKGEDLSQQGSSEATTNSFLYKVKTGENSWAIRQNPLHPGTNDLIAGAEEKFSANDWAGAERLYRMALAGEPEYFKTHTLLGDCLFQQKKYDSAIQCFKRALAINPYDYQASWFTSDAYVELGRKDSALTYIIKAWAVNRNHKDITRKTVSLAKAAGFTMTENRARFHFRVERESAGRIMIVFQDSLASEEMGLAFCLACYEFEPKFRKFIQPGAFNRKMYLNCLGNHHQMLAGKENRKDIHYPINRTLLELLRRKLAVAYVVWEIGLGADPLAVFLTDDEELPNIERYIREYVLQPADRI